MHQDPVTQFNEEALAKLKASLQESGQLLDFSEFGNRHERRKAQAQVRRLHGKGFDVRRKDGRWFVSQQKSLLPGIRPMGEGQTLMEAAQDLTTKLQLILDRVRRG